ALGRIAGEFFTAAAHKDDARERESKRRALGVYEAQVTHRLEPVDATKRLIETPVPHQPGACAGNDRLEWYRWKAPAAGPQRPDSLTDNGDLQELARILAAYDFSKEVVFDNVVLRPTAAAGDHQPMIVATAHEAVIDGHNGIFSEPLLEFLLRYIGFIEVK